MEAKKLGRPPMNSERKVRNTAFALTPDVIKKIERESMLRNISKSQYVREAILNYENK